MTYIRLSVRVQNIFGSGSAVDNQRNELKKEKYAVLQDLKKTTVTNSGYVSKKSITVYK